MRRLLAVAALALVACVDATYVGEEGFHTFAMTAESAPIELARDTAIFLVEQTIELPIRAPREARFAALSEIPEGVVIPYARLPWVERHVYELQVDYVVINLDEREHRVTLVLNGGNEFHEYFPGVTVDDEEVIPDYSGYERTIVIPPLGRFSGTIREEEIDEIAVDLATVVNGVSNANMVVHPNSHSAHDPRVIPFVPSVVPALVALRLGVRVAMEADDDAEPPPAPGLVVEWTIRVRDPNDRIVSPQRAWPLPAREAFEPSSLVVED